MANRTNLGTGTSRSSAVPVDTYSPWYQMMAMKWKKVDILLGGTDAIRAAKSTYLPKFPLETDELYDWRLQNAVLTSFFKHMADQMVGKIFYKPIEIKTTIPKEIIADIDRQGASIHTVARQLAFDMITKGMSHIFVDYPKIEGEITAKEAKARNVRPFWVRICPENLFAASTSRVNDEDELGQIRWNEIGTDIYEFDERQFLRIRVVKEKYAKSEDGDLILTEMGKPIFDGIEWQIWEETTDRIFPPPKDKVLGKSGNFALVESGDFGLGKIPIVTAYADRTGFFTSALPLEDVAHLNIKHWQATSDLDNIIRLSQAPLFFMKGFQDRPEAKGANIVYFAEGEGEDVQFADMKYVEPTGKGIEAGEKMIARIMQEAQMIGVRLQERSRSIETATGEQLAKIEDASPLQLISLSLESQLKRALDFTSDWLGIPRENEIKVNKDFAFTGDENEAAKTVALALSQGVLTGKTYLEHLKEYGILKQTVDPELEAKMGIEEFLQRNQKVMQTSVTLPKTAEGVQGNLNTPT